QGQDPLGKHIRLEFCDGCTAEVIGVAGHVKESALDGDATNEERSQLYLPVAQLSDVLAPLAVNAISGIVRAKLPPAALMSSIRKESPRFDNRQAVHSEQLMTDAIAASLQSRRFSLVVLGIFAVTALVLSMVGIYSVVSYFVSQRINEIGVRLALGANRTDILVNVLAESGR